MSGFSFRRWGRRIGLAAIGVLLLSPVLPITSASAATTTQTVTVPATQAWTDTGISLPAGNVTFTASGVINVSGGNPSFDNTPAGQGEADPECVGGPDTPWGDDWVADGLPCWSLIGRVGNSAPFEIGDGATYRLSGPGELYLGVNDQADAFGDNSGSWTAQVTWTPTAPSCAYTPTVTFSPSSASLGSTFTISGAGWAPGGMVTSTIPYGSPGWFTGYQAPTVNANGTFSYKETVGTGPNGATPPGVYPFTYVESSGGCSLKYVQNLTVRVRNVSAPNQKYAGYGVTGLPNGHASVAGSWTVPAAHCTLGLKTASGFWVGLGAINAPVEQIATDSNCGLLGKASYGAIWGIYGASGYTPLTTLDPKKYPVSPGDVMAASVSYSGGKYTFTMSDSGKSHTWTFGPRTVSGPTENDAHNQAVWIAEAPTATFIQPLTNFGTVYFTGCLANGRSINSASVIYTFDLTVPSFNNLFKARPSGLQTNGTAFNVKWSLT